MAGEWNPTTLAKVLSFSNGKSSPDRADNLPYPVYGSNGTIGFAKETNAEPNTIVIGRVGSYCGSLYFSKEKCWVTDNAIRASAIGDNDAKFLLYLLQTLDLNHWRAGSGQPLLNQTILGSITTSIPEPDDQRAIAHILGTLDDKIELNRRMNETLEAIARAIFKSWFVDFDPVRAKASGEPPESICRRLGLTPDLLALFPDRLVDSELGEIPEGWEQKRVDDLMELAYGKALKASDRVEGSVPVYGSGGITGYHSEHLVDGPGIIVGRKGTVGSLYWEDRSFFPIDTVFYVVPKVQLTYCYYLLQTLGLDRMNTDAAVPGLNRNNVYRLPVAWSPVELRHAFDRIAKPLRERIFANKQESQTLENIRDALLPKLLCGELRVSEADSNIEACA